LGVEAGALLRFGQEPKPPRGWAGAAAAVANGTVSLEDCQARLADGVDGLDEEVIDRFAALPAGCGE